MKVAELQGALLDYWVARAEGMNPKIIKGHCYCEASEVANGGLGYYQPSTNWAVGGPIIWRELIEIGPGDDGNWEALVCQRRSHHPVLGIPTGINLYVQGDHPLTAAMRAYVASKFGDEVEDAAPLAG